MLIKDILSICILKVIIKTPIIWHNGIQSIGNSAIATNVTQNAKILEKKSLYCKTCIKYKNIIIKNVC